MTQRDTGSKVPASAIIAIVSAVMVVIVLLLPRPISVLALIPGLSLFASMIWMIGDLDARSRGRRRRRFLDGACPQCGYDLRGSAADAQRCSECGARRWAPEQPLEWPEELWPDITPVLPPGEMVMWMLERRPPTFSEAWGEDDLRQNVARVVAGACFPSLPPLLTLPADPFAIVSSGVSAESFAKHIGKHLGVHPSLETCSAFENMTVGQVVDEIVALIRRQKEAGRDSLAMR